MKKLLAVIRTSTFILVLLTTIPLFINYITGQEPVHRLIVHLHVWFGLIFFIVAIPSMLFQLEEKRNKKKIK